MTTKTVPIGICAADLIAWMNESQGVAVTRRQLHYAVETAKIPRPFTTRSGDFSWRPDDLRGVVAYFRDPVRPGRPRKRAS